MNSELSKQDFQMADSCTPRQTITKLCEVALCCIISSHTCPELHLVLEIRVEANICTCWIIVNKSIVYMLLLL